MTTFNTGNPVPSTDGRDLSDNAESIDEFVDGATQTTTTRTGKTVLTRLGLEAQYVFTAINNGVWAAGQSFTAVNQFMVFSGTAYKPKNSTTLPYVVGATPVGDGNVEVVGNLSTAQGDLRYLRGFDELSTAIAATDLFDGQSIQNKELTTGAGGGSTWDIVLLTTVTPNGDDIFASTGSPLLALVRRDDTRLEKKVDDHTVLRSQAGIAALSNSQINSIATSLEDKQWDVSVSVNGLENTPDTIKMADARFAERVGGFKPQRLGVFVTSALFGHRAGDMHYRKFSQTNAELITDLSKWIPYTIDDVSPANANITVGYVDSAKINDNTGDGLSWATAKASLDAGNALGTDVLLIKGGFYNRINRLLSFTLTKDRSFIAVGGKAIIGVIASGTWTKTIAQTNVWQLDYAPSLTNVTNAVYDTKQLNSEGAASFYTSVASIAAVDALPGSFFHTGTTTYVNTLDSRDLVIHGDEIRLTQPVANTVITYAGDFKLYWQDIENWGGTTGASNNLTLFSDNNSYPGSSFYNRDCTFAASQDASGGIALAVGDVGVVISERVTATNNRRDGLNYHFGTLYGKSALAPHGIEIDVQIHGNGELGSEGNNQGSTAHEDCKVFRINGDYSGHADGGSIVDIDGVKAYNVCCTTKDSSVVGMLLSASGFPFEVTPAQWWVDGGHCSGNPAISNGAGDIAVDGFFSILHMQDTDTEKPLSTRTFSDNIQAPDEDFS